MLVSLLLPSYRNKLKNRLQHFSSVVFKVFDYFITFPATLATRSIGHDKQTEVTGKNFDFWKVQFTNHDKKTFEVS